MKSNNLKRLPPYVSLLLFVASFFMPALQNYRGVTLFSGGILLLTFYAGFSGFFIGLFWFSNVAYIVGFVAYLRNKHSSTSWLIVAFFIGFLFFVVTLLNMFWRHSDLLGDIAAFKIGFWCWLTSFIIIPVSTLFKKPE